MKIFVAGGTGFVGTVLCETLRESGHSVRLLVHRRRDHGPDGMEQVEGDAADLDSFCGSVAGCDAVINLIGIIREFAGRGVTFEKLHVEATRNMVAAAEKVGIRRYLQMSALGSRPNAVSQYHRTKWRAEELVRGSGLEWTIFRPSLIFGPGDAFVNMVADQIRKLPVVPVIGDGKYRLQPIFVKDVARCFVKALAMPETVGNAYELCGPDRLTYLELIDTIATAVGRSRPVKMKNPLLLMKLATALLEQFPIYPVTLDQIQMLIEESICDGSWQETFGFTPTRFGEGIASYLQAN
ncbi:NADH dehydrogenase [ubiquinone] 1 alpha subcomplex subunit 9, mitochondrial [Geobacter sp. OR-1]|uniref:complex I NDUFA9 subunit family protein n=1 Tax=Geobacter sp. OR-1 TaxID=1266765 RepID=UPI00054223DD|nr:complex I NDUFA9 subunit family protein [Geobacter sp. OR-1]GAM09733.1 NADH dehydrogenase [ubiquinone] 1 alpha subcomplex subunit 9, mitochondrial [Geobacter sp. OR-1]